MEELRSDDDEIVQPLRLPSCLLETNTIRRPEPLSIAEAITGGKDQNTQWVHGEFIVSSETIRPPHTQWVHGEFF